MDRLHEVRLAPLSLDRFAPLLGEGAVNDAKQLAQAMRERMGERCIWNVSSTAVGGGVAEMLLPLLSYTRGAGIDARWVVLEGSPEFFRITKRLHNALHGEAGDGSPLGPEERAIYEATAQANATELLSLVRPADVVILHDPQTTGLAPLLLRAGARVIWRCHIGRDTPNEQTELGWAFLLRYLDDVRAIVFSRAAYVPRALDQPGRCAIIVPSIDPFSPKNEALDAPTVQAILARTGIIADQRGSGSGKPVFLRDDGTPERVDRAADVVRLGQAPGWETPLVVQVSRWDGLKDPTGVLAGFAALAAAEEHRGAELVLAGPELRAVADDPDGPRVFGEVVEAWRALPRAIRGLVHLACLPSEDIEENAAIVNALQRHATIVVQKSLREGFGLTVTEAMWKRRAVVASAVGGMQDQIEDGVHGLLVPDPRDLGAFAAALGRLLADPGLRERLGAAAHERVRARFLGIRHLFAYAEIIERLDRTEAP